MNSHVVPTILALLAASVAAQEPFGSFQWAPSQPGAYLTNFADGKAIDAGEPPLSAPGSDFMGWPQQRQLGHLRYIAATRGTSGTTVAGVRAIVPPREAADPSPPGEGQFVGFVVCWDYRAGYPHKGKWKRRGQPTVLWVKAKGRGRCAYVPASLGPHPTTMSWVMVMMLFEDGGPTNIRYFPKEELTPVWRENEGSYNGTQITAGKCENGKYRSLVAIFVTPPAGFTYHGPRPLATDSTTGAVANCPT